MQLGIIGLPQSGKTTIFNALTKGNRPTSVGSGQFAVNTAVVDVPDSRVNILTEMFHPRKTTFAKNTFADITGLNGAVAEKGFSGPLLNELAQMDGFLHVVRCFDDERVPHPNVSIDPQRDIEIIEGELLLHDLLAVERKLERIAADSKRGGRDKAALAREEEFFNRINTILSEEQPLRTITFTEEEYKALSGYGLFTMKPVLVVLNLGDDQQAPEITPPAGCIVTALQGRLEMEIAQFSDEDAVVFMEEFGIKETSLARMIRLSYDLLKLQSFFTVGDDEVRAWTVARGAKAPQAAGVIHSDLEKGFIRAEVIDYNTLISLGGLSQARAVGGLRVEGKTYTVQDGDILNIRFNL